MCRNLDEELLAFAGIVRKHLLEGMTLEVERVKDFIYIKLFKPPFEIKQMFHEMFLRDDPFALSKQIDDLARLLDMKRRDSN